MSPNKSVLMWGGRLGYLDWGKVHSMLEVSRYLFLCVINLSYRCCNLTHERPLTESLSWLEFKNHLKWTYTASKTFTLSVQRAITAKQLTLQKPTLTVLSQLYIHSAINLANNEITLSGMDNLKVITLSGMDNLKVYIQSYL